MNKLNYIHIYKNLNNNHVYFQFLVWYLLEREFIVFPVLLTELTLLGPVVIAGYDCIGWIGWTDWTDGIT